MDKDKYYYKMINTGRWQRMRRQVLMAHPVCQRCEAEGFVTAATEVHHITPVESVQTRSEQEQLMFSIGNLCALCHRCHVQTHIELGSKGKQQNKTRTENEVKSFARRYYASQEQ